MHKIPYGVNYCEKCGKAIIESEQCLSCGSELSEMLDRNRVCSNIFFHTELAGYDDIPATTYDTNLMYGLNTHEKAAVKITEYILKEDSTRKEMKSILSSVNEEYREQFLRDLEISDYDFDGERLKKSKYIFELLMECDDEFMALKSVIPFLQFFELWSGVKIFTEIGTSRIIKTFDDADYQCEFYEVVKKYYMKDCYDIKKDYGKKICVNKLETLIAEIKNDEKKVELIAQLVNEFGIEYLHKQIILTIFSDEKKLELMELIADNLDDNWFEFFIKSINDDDLEKEMLETIKMLGKSVNLEECAEHGKFKTICNQKQLKKIPENYKGSIVILGGNPENPIIIDKQYNFERIIVIGNSCLVLKNQKNVYLDNCSEAVVENCNNVILMGNSLVYAYGKSHIIANGKSRILLQKGEFNVVANEQVIVKCDNFIGKGNIEKNGVVIAFEEVDEKFKNAPEIVFDIKLEQLAKFSTMKVAPFDIDDFIFGCAHLRICELHNTYCFKFRD